MTVAVISVGYVGLPLAQALAATGRETLGFDLQEGRVSELNRGIDRNDPEGAGFVVPDCLRFTSNPEDLRGCSAYLIAVPTPIDADRRPDLAPLISASQMVGGVLAKGALVVVESTVHPGATETVVIPELEAVSGLKAGVDFKVGYSPERINPGDQRHGLAEVVKVVSGLDAPSLQSMVELYGPIVPAGLHQASSIMVAEAAKITENVQRDVNIALMNELALVFDRIGIRTEDVLQAARTKWNFAPFSPGLVGGHCIGVDPYYLIARAEAEGYYPELIRSARRLNDGISEYVADKLVLLLASEGVAIKGAKVAVLGITFKEDVSDIRNSQIPAIIDRLQELGAELLVVDPLVDAEVARRELGIELAELADLAMLDGLVLASPHRTFLAGGGEALLNLLKPNGLLIDIKSRISSDLVEPDYKYWSL